MGLQFGLAAGRAAAQGTAAPKQDPRLTEPAQRPKSTEEARPDFQYVILGEAKSIRRITHGV